MRKSFIDRYYEESETKGFWTINKKIGACFIVLFLAVMMLTGCTQEKTEELVEINEELPKESVKVGNDGVNAAIAPDDVTIVSQQTDAKKESTVAMSVEDTGRSDPFLPEGQHQTIAKAPQGNFDLLPPPETITVDTQATEVITTKVSGIMYDRINPSAILRISDSDYLVRTGDVINGYKVLSIGKETVTVQYGANVYKAGVGELFSGDGIKFNTVSNLESKFGGRKNMANTNRSRYDK